MAELRWMGNNTEAVNKLLAEHHARAEPDSGRLHLVGIGLNTHISVGDTLLVEGERLGIKRSKADPQIAKYVTWAGDNVLEIDDFLTLYGVRLEVMNERLNVYAGQNLMASLGRGDRITKADAGNIIVSLAGQHHRA
jgi:hypothetical protein